VLLVHCCWKRSLYKCSSVSMYSWYTHRSGNPMFIHPPGHHTPIRAIVFFSYRLISLKWCRSVLINHTISRFQRRFISIFNIPFLSFYLSLFIFVTCNSCYWFWGIFLIRRKFCLFFRGAAFRNIFFFNSSFIR